jgi:dipeptidase
MSYAIYIGRNLTSDGHAWLAGYGDEPSSHWLEICPHTVHQPGTSFAAGVGKGADLPGQRIDLPQASETFRHLRVSYSYYKGVPAPITNGGLNEHGVAVRDVWSPSRTELIDMTPKDQRGLNYSDLARICLERARSARHGVELMGELIAQHGEASYGGNSHLIADSSEAWVVIQFAGGKGLWAAERLGADSIRASRPGYIHEIPVNEPGHMDYLYSPNLLSFAREMGWYNGGPFDVNAVYGDGKGRWEGVAWIEQEMRERAAQSGKIGLADVIWAIRTGKLTGDSAGYGQVVPLTDHSSACLRMLWHAPIGPLAAPFAPVYMGQDNVPPEFQKHRYLTTGEDHRFMDTRRDQSFGADVVSQVSQAVEGTRCAVYECKRLLYLMLQDADRFVPEITRSLEDCEARLFETTARAISIAQSLAAIGDEQAACAVLDYFSCTELVRGLNLVTAMADSIEARLKTSGTLRSDAPMNGLPQIW